MDHVPETGVGLVAGQRPPPSRGRRRKALFVLLSLLGLALLGGGRSLARADAPPNPLTVTGEGAATLPPDIAQISGTVQTSAATAADALNQNSQAVNAVIAAVEAVGVRDSDVTTTGLQVNPISQSGVTVSYQARNSVTAKTAALGHVGDLVQTMVSAGLTNVDRVTYGLQDPEQLPTQALQTAAANTQQEAQAIATALGLKLGPPLDFSADPGLREPDPLAAPPPAPGAPGAASVVPGPFTATAHVTVTFSVFAP